MSSPRRLHSPTGRGKGFGFRSEKSRDKLKICTELSEMKPLLSDGVKIVKGPVCGEDGGEAAAAASEDGSAGGGALASPGDVANFGLMKAEQYSALFETDCEIEYISHKNILAKATRIGCRKSQRRKEGMGKSHSATSSPIRYGESSSGALREPDAGEARPKSDMDVSSVGGELAKIGEARSGAGEIARQKSRQSSRSSSCSGKRTGDDVWEPAGKEANFFKAPGQTLPTSSDSKQVIETTC